MMRAVRLGGVVAAQGLDPDLGAVVIGRHADCLIGVLGEVGKTALEAALSAPS